MTEGPNIRQSTRPPRRDRSTRYEFTPHETDSLANQDLETTRPAASIRRRRHLREELESSLRHEQLIAAQEQLVTAQLEAHRKSDAIRRVLRHEENLAYNDGALSSRSCPNKGHTCLDRTTTAANNRPRLGRSAATFADTGERAWSTRNRKWNQTGTKTRNRPPPPPKKNRQVLESTVHARTAGAASSQWTEAVSQRTLSHLPTTSIDSHVPPPHSALNSSFALPLVQSDLNYNFALPPAHSAFLPVNDISPKQPPCITQLHWVTHSLHQIICQVHRSTSWRSASGNSLLSLKSTACIPSCAGQHSSLNHHRRTCLQLQTAWSRPQYPSPKANVIRLQQPQLPMKLQTANLPLSRTQHRHQPLLRPSRNARRRTARLLQPQSLSVTMHRVVVPGRWSRRSGRTTHHLHRRPTTESISIAIDLKASQHRLQHQPHPLKQQKFHLSTTPDQLVAAAVTLPRSLSTAYP